MSISIPIKQLACERFFHFHSQFPPPFNCLIFLPPPSPLNQSTAYIAKITLGTRLS